MFVLCSFCFVNGFKLSALVKKLHYVMFFSQVYDTLFFMGACLDIGGPLEGHTLIDQ